MKEGKRKGKDTEGNERKERRKKNQCNPKLHLHVTKVWYMEKDNPTLLGNNQNGLCSTAFNAKASF